MDAQGEPRRSLMEGDGHERLSVEEVRVHLQASDLEMGPGQGRSPIVAGGGGGVVAPHARSADCGGGSQTTLV